MLNKISNVTWHAPNIFEDGGPKIYNLRKVLKENSLLLIRDIEKNKELLTNEPDQFYRRNYLRSLVCFYEFGLSNLREKAINVLILKFDPRQKFKIAHLAHNFNFHPNISISGKLQDYTPNNVPFISLLTYTIKILTKNLLLSKDFIQDNRWSDFKKTIIIRNRITHPKLDADILISDTELYSIENGFEWWSELLDDICQVDNNFKPESIFENSTD